MINQGVRASLGGLHSAQLLMYSVEFQPIEENMRSGRWDLVASELAGAARILEAGGADFILICTNTMHKVFTDVQAVVDETCYPHRPGRRERSPKIGIFIIGPVRDVFYHGTGFLKELL